MPKIVRVRPVLLSAPYAYPGYLEVTVNLKSGLRTCGMVEVTLEDGTTGLGEGYLAVFAPRVFVEIVELMAPYVVGKEAMDVSGLYRDMCSVTGYWSLQGAARHVVSAFEIALLDAKARYLRIPLYSLLGGKAVDAIPVYGSGGDSGSPAEMEEELEMLERLGIHLFKIRAQNYEAAKTAWTLRNAARRGIRVAVDMCQNLSNPAQSVSDVVRYVQEVGSKTPLKIEFLEEALGPLDISGYTILRSKVDTRICGGEIITTAAEMAGRIAAGIYDFVQPDATVIGGAGQVMEVFAAARRFGIGVVVHCWGGAVGMMANYHAAFAGGGALVEWPMPKYEIREALMETPLKLTEGKLIAGELPGLGVRLTPEVEREYRFREEAVYTCLEDLSVLPSADIWEE